MYCHINYWLTFGFLCSSHKSNNLISLTAHKTTATHYISIDNSSENVSLDYIYVSKRVEPPTNIYTEDSECYRSFNLSNMAHMYVIQAAYL